MDEREAMAFSDGSGSYYMHRAGGVGGSGSGGMFQQTPSGFRTLSNPHGGSDGSAFSVEVQHGSFNHGVVSNSIGSSSGTVVPYSSDQPVKKKRGRPRKYGPDVPVSLRLSPMSATANSTPVSEKRPRGRPPGSGRKQQLASLGEWMNTSAGQAFSPHVITIGVQEDIVAKLLAVSQHRPRALCIFSGTGTVSSVTLRQPASTSASVTYEGRFQILCLSGSYLVAEDGGPQNRTGGISVSLSSPDGHVIGGGVARLIAASPVQVVLCSFVYGGSKPKTPKQGTTTKDDDDSEPQSSDQLASPGSAPPNQNYTASGTEMWLGSRSVDVKNAHPHTGIDLMHG
ncbi:AT hook motif DNA-binding family protein [Trifolium repens]|nr:AT hook motif DNA-binding family protein [Trifolium repens]